MMNKFFIATTILFFIGLTNANAEEFFRCKVSDGRATAYYCHINGGGSNSSHTVMYIDAFDEDWISAGSSFCVGVGIVINGCTKLCSITVDKDATFCTIRDL